MALILIHRILWTTRGILLATYADPQLQGGGVEAVGFNVFGFMPRVRLGHLITIHNNDNNNNSSNNNRHHHNNNKVRVHVKFRLRHAGLGMVASSRALHGRSAWQAAFVVS